MKFIPHLFLLFVLVIPSVSNAKSSVFSNPVQLQALNNLRDIMDDATRMNLKRSSESINLTLQRINVTVRALQALGNISIKPSRQNAYRPYAFIQSSMDRRKLIKSLTELAHFHRQYRQALQQKNQARIKQLKKSIHSRHFDVMRIQNKWRSKVGTVGIRPKTIKKPFAGKICRNLLPHEKFYSQWESCCDIGKNKSRWLNRATNRVSTWNGSCRSWGMR